MYAWNEFTPDNTINSQFSCRCRWNYIVTILWCRSLHSSDCCYCYFYLLYHPPTPNTVSPPQPPPWLPSTAITITTTTATKGKGVTYPRRSVGRVLISLTEAIKRIVDKPLLSVTPDYSHLRNPLNMGYYSFINHRTPSWPRWLAGLQRTVYPQSGHLPSCKTSVVHGKIVGQDGRSTHCTTQPTNNCRQSIINMIKGKLTQRSFIIRRLELEMTIGYVML